ncbi:hypothetical protein B296_00015547 [Ensete ventricosum]|uniref:Uncharacterized protein n=1 Tax=Ensete ventricosum TaxID=4639 RepID=A0A426ZTV5_ENSVE|nr:hypothetical protein B296_00015547 [Ensete ventricosum]
MSSIAPGCGKVYSRLRMKGVQAEVEGLPSKLVVESAQRSSGRVHKRGPMQEVRGRRRSTPPFFVKRFVAIPTLSLSGFDDQRRKKKKKLPVGGHAESTCLVPSLPPPSQDPISVSRRPKVSDLWSPHTPSLISLSLSVSPPPFLSRDLGFEFEFEIRVFTSRSGFLLDPGVESASPAVEGWFLIHRRRHPDLYCDGGHGGPEPVSRVHDAGRRAPLGRGRRRGIGQAADFHLS